jgi:hypothetical protein
MHMPDSVGEPSTLGLYSRELFAQFGAGGVNQIPPERRSGAQSRRVEWYSAPDRAGASHVQPEQALRATFYTDRWRRGSSAVQGGRIVIVEQLEQHVSG